jgi:hypothetical protein
MIRVIEEDAHPGLYLQTSKCFVACEVLTGAAEKKDEKNTKRAHCHQRFSVA